MTITQETLTRWQSISAIAAAVLIPIVLGVAGFFIQRQVASEGLKKDYVQIAVTILEKSPPRSPELREWAVELLAENSPVPLSEKVKLTLKREGLRIADPVNLRVTP